MHIVSTAIKGTIQKGELQTEQALSLFPDGTEVIVIDRQGWNQIAGSDHVRHQLSQARTALEEIAKINPAEKGKEIAEKVLGVRK